jgi:hypothetical protein
MKNKTFKKGYYLEIKSWENDYDNVKTETKYIGESEEDALNLLKMFSELFQIHNNQGSVGVGNMMDDDYEKGNEKISEYLENNPEVSQSIKNYWNARGCEFTDERTIHVDDVSELAYDLVGTSEYYFARVFESGSVFEVPETVTFITVERKVRR